MYTIADRVCDDTSITTPARRWQAMVIVSRVFVCAAMCLGGLTSKAQSPKTALELPAQTQPSAGETSADAPADAAAARAEPDTQEQMEQKKDEDVELGSIGRRVNASDNLLRQLLDSARLGERAGLIEHGPVSMLHPHWVAWNQELEEKFGLRLGISYYVLFQYTTGGPDTQEAASGDLDFFGRWKLFRSERGGQGMLGFNLEHRHAYTDIPPSQLRTEIGSIWRTTRGFSDSGFNVNELWWDHRLADDRIWFRVGTINQKHFYDLHRFKSQKRFFLSSPYSDSPTIAFPRNGLGGVIRVSPLEQLHITAGMGDGNGKRRVGGFDTFFGDGEFFTATDIAFTPTIEGLGEGRYSVTLWHTDARSDTPSGEGISALIEQEVVEGIVPFVRFGYGDGANLLIEHMVALGVGIEAPFGRDDDVAGFAASWADPHGGLRDQWGFETFYRLQLTRAMQLTPGFQLIVDPSQDPTEHVVGVFSLRFGLVF